MTLQTTNKSSSLPIPGAGIDAPRERRPGVPMELSSRKPAGAAHWKEPDRQRDPGNVLKRKGLDELTPVFGTANPPRGISGLMRRVAYSIPDHATTHWLVLLLADRVDAIEHGGIARLFPLMFPLVAGGAAFAIRRGRRRRSWATRIL